MKKQEINEQGELIPTETRLLRRDLSAKEVHDYSLLLASKTKELTLKEEEKKSVTAQYTASIKELLSGCNKLANIVSDGFELAEVECQIIYNKPERGKKEIIRKDTNKVSSIEPMTDDEWNLFNQS